MSVFKKDENNKRRSYPTVPEVEKTNSFIGKTLFIKGEIFSDEEIVVEGKIEGKLNVKHRVIIAKNGVINADIDGKEIVIKGRVNGNVKSNYKVEIVPGGVLNGNIVSQKVVLAEGAIFRGNINMTIDDEILETKDEKGKLFQKKENKEKKDQLKD